MSMQASATSHPAAEELMAYGDGEASANVVAHVDGCSTCTDQASSYAQMQGSLRRSLFRLDCPDAHTLREYQLDLLEPAHRRPIAAPALHCDPSTLPLQPLRLYLSMPTPTA